MISDQQRITQLENRVRKLEKILYLYSGGVQQPEYQPIEFETRFQGLVVLIQSAFDLAGNVVDASAGSSLGYTRIRIAGTEVKVQVYDLS